MTSEELQRKQISAILDALEALLALIGAAVPWTVRGSLAGRTAITKAQEAINRLRNLVVKGSEE